MFWNGRRDFDMQPVRHTRIFAKPANAAARPFGARPAHRQFVGEADAEPGVDFVQRYADAAEMPSQAAAQIDKPHMQPGRSGHRDCLELRFHHQDSLSKNEAAL